MDIKIKALKQPPDSPSPLPSEILLQVADSLTIGREPSCDLTLPCSKKIISRQHIRISQHQNEFKLTDLSANGTFINGATQPIGLGNTLPITHQDILDLGEYQLQFYFQSAKKITPIDQQPTDKELNNNGATTLLNKNSITQTSTKINRAPIANTRESFIPPSVKIPEDWDQSLKSPSASQTSQVPETLKKPIQLSNENELFQSLLRGMGLLEQQENITFTKDNMLAIGRCLRTSVNGLIKQCDHAKHIKSKLCFDEKSMLSELDYAPLANFKSSEQFLIQLLKDKHNMHLYFPLEISKCHKELMQDFSITLKSYNKAIDAFREELSPFEIEKEYKASNNRRSSLTNKILPTIGKWEFYKRLWSDKCLNFRKIIKVNFEKNIRELHKQRISQRKIAKN